MNHRHMSSRALLLFGDGIKRQYFPPLFKKQKSWRFLSNSFCSPPSTRRCFLQMLVPPIRRRADVSPIIETCCWGLSYVVNSILAILCLAMNKNPNKAKTPWSLFSKLDVKITQPEEALSTGLWNLAALQPVSLVQLQAPWLAFRNKHPI